MLEPSRAGPRRGRLLNALLGFCTALLHLLRTPRAAYRESHSGAESESERAARRHRLRIEAVSRSEVIRSEKIERLLDEFDTGKGG
jgi:hypothetical protein